jgi:hypothetical protein
MEIAKMEKEELGIFSRLANNLVYCSAENTTGATPLRCRLRAPARIRARIRVPMTYRSLVAQTAKSAVSPTASRLRRTGKERARICVRAY